MDPRPMFYDGPDHIPDNATIRRTSLPELARYLVELRQSEVSWKAVAKYINAQIKSGALSPIVAHVFLNVYNDYHCIASSLRQGRSASIRRVAMNCFKKKCRYGNFPLMFSAVGGVPGLMALMATMSVREVGHFCHCLGDCTSKSIPVGVREFNLTELLKALRNDNSDSPYHNLENPDKRPLDFYYNKILPACEPSMIFEEISKNGEIREIKKITNRATKEGYVDNFNAVIFPENGISRKITPYKFVLDGNDVKFALSVLAILPHHPNSLKLNADNLIQDLARPLARRLNNRREGEGLRELFYSSLIDCLDGEPSIANKLDYSMISYAIKAWSHAHKYQERMQLHLAILVRRMTNDYQWTLDRIANELQHIVPRLRPTLLRLLLRNASFFKVDIDFTFVGDRVALGSLGKAWPPKLFYLLPNDISLRLFELLRGIHPDGKFIAKGSGITKGVDYTNCDDEQYGDPDMILALLQSRQRYNEPYGMIRPIET
ncbi:uncharacterized protein F4807DRAFT_468783 [Annulohypoxylon truncatum]|uniref:uncharacterized protein n=1 Tax=Annulohypoxylon truncatum TaxID=327061 RepID=UPI002007720E|nr:uncharacterized protein F4807DRAFT_468783 [Annulohypoxylon truncatum]KAI1208202.1 hypothetical protein F4807DRAFT_468783 [Annulohypoxylon truncatum]